MFRAPDALEEACVDRREAIVKRGEQRRGFVPYWLRTMAEVDVDFLEAYERIYELTAVRKGKLPPKFREMIVVAAVSIGGYLPGIKDHVRRALRLGATREELIEVFQSAYFHTGALTLVHGMVALIDVLKELEAEQEPAARAATRGARRPAKRRAGRVRDGGDRRSRRPASRSTR
jgi:alkylhydroperoxidase/carboxymuconolactone decarboxylase family protein YurZ